MRAVVRVAVFVMLAACSGDSNVVDDAATGGDARVDDAIVDTSADATAIDTSLSSVTVDRTQAVSGVEQVTVTVILRATDGSPLAGIDVELTASGAANVFSQVSPTDVNGQTSATWTSGVAELKYVSAVAAGVTINGPPVNFSPGPATKLAFTQQPTNVIAGAAFAPALRIEAQDAFGNVVPTQTGTVFLFLDANPASTNLRGGSSMPLQNGVAVFPSSHVDVAGVGYSIRAQLSGLTTATSDLFDVTWGPPSAARSTMMIAPQTVEANGVDTAQITIHIANAYNIPIPSVPLSVVVSGSNNTIVPATGMTNTTGDFRSNLASTTVEMKDVLGTDGTIMMMGPVRFMPAGCTPLLPGPPETAVDAHVSAIHVADIDGDGNADAVLGMAPQIGVYIGSGDGSFGAPVYTTLPSGDSVDTIESGDFNSDGHMDLVLARNSVKSLTVLLGAGNGQFTIVTTVLPNFAKQLGVADFNLDGQPDVVAFLPYAQSVVIELGDGTGTFTTSATISGDVYDLALVDANSDGKQDIVMSRASLLATAIGNGNGTFEALTTTSADSGQLVTGDMNGDTKVDVGVAEIDGTVTPYLGDGTGAFAAKTPVTYRDPGPSAFQATGGAVTDLDGDNNADIIIAAGGATTILKGDGTGSFALVARYDASTYEVAKVNGDTYYDLLTADSHGISVVAGSSSTAFVAPQEVYRSTDWSPRLYETTADFNGDGRTDYVRYRSTPNSLMCAMLDQSDGSIVQASSSAAPPSTDPYDVVAGDFTGDGVADIAIVNGAVTGVTLGIAAGNGTGALAAFTTQNVTSPYTERIAGGDFDQDGMQDLVMWRDGYANVAIARSTGTAFTAPTTYSTSSVNAVQVADVSQDGVPDVIVRSGTDLRVFRGNGVGGLSTGVSNGMNGLSGAFAIGDMTGDDIPDLVLLESNPVTALRTLVVRPGLGGGSFGTPYVTPNIRLPKLLMYERIALVDMTGDGIRDLVIHSTYGTTVVGGFGDGYVRQTAYHYPVDHEGGAGHGAPIDSFIVVDHDGDGDEDVVYGQSGLFAARNNGCVP